jgi:hypothetical protein
MSVTSMVLFGNMDTLEERERKRERKRKRERERERERETERWHQLSPAPSRLYKN